MDAAPTALFLYDALCYPTEMLRIPEGLRICRPITGLVYTSEKVNAILVILCRLIPFSPGAEEYEIEIRWLPRGLCPKIVYIE